MVDLCIYIEDEQDIINTILDGELVLFYVMENSDPDLRYEFLEDYSECD